MTVTVLLTLLLLWHCCCPVFSAQPAIIQGPQNVTVGLNQQPVNLFCTIRGENIFLRIDDKLVGHNTIEQFAIRGITFDNPTVSSNGSTTQTITVAARQENNGTIVVCHATSEGFARVDSYISTVLVAGPPLRPVINYEVLDELVIQVSWEEPFSMSGFPINGYILNITDTYTPSVYSWEELTPDLHYFNLTQNDTSSCTNLTFSIRAQNNVGSSSPGITYGAFPSRPGEFIELPSSEVTFSREGSAILQINFTFPMLCPYNNATYTLMIKDARGRLIDTDGPNVQLWQDGSMPVMRNMRETKLELHACYNVNITVQTLAGQISTTFEFNTSYMNSTACSEATSPPAKTEVITMQRTSGTTVHAWSIAAASAGTVLLMLCVTALILCVVYTHRRRAIRIRACVHTTELAEHVGRRMPMVVNPIYEGGGAIYEEIPDPSLKGLPAQPTSAEREEGYVSIASVAQNRTKCNPDRRPDEVYTMMNSVGTLLGQLGGGAASLDSPEQPPSLYSNIDDDGASAKCGGWKMPKDTDPEGRYVSI